MPTIATLAYKAAATLQTEAPRASTRRCSAEEIGQAIRLHLRAARTARRTHPDATIRTTLCGGHVTNGYRYAADTDHVVITGGYARELRVTATRAYAQSRPHGRGATLLVRRVSPGQSTGTIMESY